MSLDLITNWISDASSVTDDEIDQAILKMYDLLPTGANLCLLAALTEIKNNNPITAQSLLGRYKAQIK